MFRFMRDIYAAGSALPCVCVVVTRLFAVAPCAQLMMRRLMGDVLIAFFAGSQGSPRSVVHILGPFGLCDKYAGSQSRARALPPHRILWMVASPAYWRDPYPTFCDEDMATNLSLLVAAGE
mmetsp:Transcript_830/g.2242  ORF Transcript_830/g.2242 Transcript_830/m.2242 type:complete len:121 (+) Transcript_830:478-840(+)